VIGSRIVRGVVVVLAIGLPSLLTADDLARAPASISPELDRAAADLATGRVEKAIDRFRSLSDDASGSSFLRGLAGLGLGDAQTAAGHAQAAAATWQRLCDDATLPKPHRDLARQRIAAARRVERGLSGYDRAAHRVELPALPKAAATFHVAPGGDDAADGSKDHPLRSLLAARDAIRAWRKAHRDRAADASCRVVIHGGSYPVTATLRLEKQDSGTASAPVVYQAAPGERPVFRGGVRLRDWKRVADAGVRERLDAAVRERVRQCDLRALGVTDFGDATALRSCPELFVDDVPQTLARWPNEGFVRTGDILGDERFKVWGRIDGCKDGKFRFVEDRPASWTDEPDVRLYGYWFWDWFEEFQTVAAVDPKARAFTLKKPYSRYGYRKDQRYRAVNVLRELDRPGEWYLDRTSGITYWLPPEGTDVADASTVLSVFREPHVIFEGVEHVILLGLTFQESRGDGIHVRGGANALIAGCAFRRLGGDAAIISGGKRHGLFGCVMHTLGCAGSRVTGGDRKALTRGEHFVENCVVYDIGRLKRTYSPAVRLDGCGNRIAHNLFESMPSSAMRVEGNDQLVELNNVRHVVKESDDQGGVDMFGNPLYRGVVIRWNRWSDIGAGSHCGGAGVRLDDMISGVHVYANVFERCGAKLFGGVQIHGGKENVIDNNLFVDCYAGISFSRWSEKRWLDSIERFLPQSRSPSYAERYPALARLREEANRSFICRNVFARSGKTFLRDGGVQKAVVNGVTAEAVDVARVQDARFVRSAPQFRSALFDPIPVDDIGPYEHPWRAVSD